ncbi:MAG: deoxyuridine 5'-triphosphate nucleotidohydrolase [Thermofilaceae archaeon]
MILSKSNILRLIEQNPPLISSWINLDFQLQPAGFDLTLREVREFKTPGQIDFGNVRRKVSETEPLPFDENGLLLLPQGAYLVIFNEELCLPPNIAAIARPRSSLLRSGATVETAVWDPGYRGRSRALLIVYNRAGITLEKNARIVQLVFMEVDSSLKEGYRGIYQGEL